MGILTMCETRVFAGRLKATFKVRRQGSHISQPSSNVYEIFFTDEFISKIS